MRLRRRRGVHVLMGTLALVAGCSTAQRAEVSGVVRDRATGRVIAGARVVGADGSLAETDGDGRFRLYTRGLQADVRVSAAGHAPEHVEIAGLETEVALAPTDDLWITSDEGTHVVSFVEETWVLDGGAYGDAAPSLGPCAETSLAEAHSAIACASCHASASASTSCASCHEGEAQSVRGMALDDAAIAPHDGLGGGCLACHGQLASHGDASSSCARCHGAGAASRRAELGRFFALATSSTADRAEHGTAFEMRSTFEAAATETTIATWARALARDRSRGAHDPRAARLVGEALVH